MSRKWRKAKLEPHAGMPAVPYGPPVAAAGPRASSGSGLKTVAVVGATIAAPYILKGIFKLLAKR